MVSVTELAGAAPSKEKRSLTGFVRVRGGGRGRRQRRGGRRGGNGRRRRSQGLGGGAFHRAQRHQRDFGTLGGGVGVDGERGGGRVGVKGHHGGVGAVHGNVVCETGGRKRGIREGIS